MKIIPYHEACRLSLAKNGPDESVSVERSENQFTQDLKRSVKVIKFKGKSQFSDAEQETKFLVQYLAEMPDGNVSDLNFTISPEAAQITCDLLQMLLNDGAEKQIEIAPPTEEQIQNEINSLSREEMCRLWRFTSHEAPEFKYFDVCQPYWVHFKKRFDELGGFSPEISKKIGF